MSDDWYENAHERNLKRMAEFYGEEHTSLIHEIYAASRRHEENNGHETRLYMPLFAARSACAEIDQRGIFRCQRAYATA